jgi:hypothetical protein
MVVGLGGDVGSIRGFGFIINILGGFEMEGC